MNGKMTIDQKSNLQQLLKLISDVLLCVMITFGVDWQVETSKYYAMLLINANF